ncbi:ribose-5-phosphate isomerase RpiA [Tautonia sociabilis]|uniref:Ribose 5-phosphate isomerase A n=1 Tax=Tautonia sociabilis TaxID=2080755 RepID=A0A432MMJ5_9BACT|nr:ribose-5-phosphate isomerase RpiA [Tautonia sociabilis]
MAEKALELVVDGSVVGLGTGHAASDFVRLLGQHVRGGLDVRGIATSRATEALAREVGVPLLGLGDVDAIDATFDGADAVDPELNLIKGLGGALLREKIVASYSRRLIILVGKEKLTDRLGRGYCKRLPVEVVPFALPLVRRRLLEMGLGAELRSREGQPVPTDNGNYTVDIDLSTLEEDPRGLGERVRAIPGVVETGLFIGMAGTVLVQLGDGTVEVLTRGG